MEHQGQQRQLKYDQVRLRLLELIAAARLAPGDRLPPERELAERLQCSAITLRKALSEMTRQGLIEKRHGAGNFLLSSIEGAPCHGKILFLDIVRTGRHAIRVDTLAETRKFLAARGLELVYRVDERFNQQLVHAARECMGIILYGWVDADWIRELRLLKLPLIVAGATLCPGLAPFVSYDAADGACRLTRELIRRGHRQIGVINGAPDYPITDQVTAGFTRAMAEACLPWSDSDMIQPEHDGKLAHAVVTFLEHRRYDALLLEVGAYLPALQWLYFHGGDYRPQLAVTPIFRNIPGTGIHWSLTEEPDLLTANYNEDLFLATAQSFWEHLRHGTELVNRLLPVQLNPPAERKTNR